MLYFDNNASTKVLNKVVEFLYNNNSDIYYNINSSNKITDMLLLSIEDIKKSIFKYHNLSERDYDIVFTPNATISNKMILNMYKDTNILTTPYEHKSILSNIPRNKRLYIEIDKENMCADLKDIEHKLQNKKNGIGLVSVIAANNEIPVRNKLKDIYNLCLKYQVPFHTDATQLFGKDVDIGSNFDLLTFSGHKFNGPKGIGGIVFNKWMFNTDQLNVKEYGTPNLPAILSLKHLFFKDENMSDKHFLELRKTFFDNLKTKEFTLIEPKDPSYLHPSTIFIDFGKCGTIMKDTLENFGVIVSLGSACSSGSAKSLKALGLENLIGVLRISFGRFTTKTEVEQLAEILNKILSKFE